MIVASIVLLAAIFAAAMLLPVNMGLIGLAAALGLGVFAAGLSVRDVLSGFPADLFVTLLGITYLFGIASRNGAVDWLVGRASAALGGRAGLMPPLVFVVAAVLTALGAAGPAAVAIVAPIALRMARQHGLSPLMMGLLTVHGAQAGSFSPISIYGGITNQVLLRSNIAPQPVLLFLASAAFNAAIALVIWAAHWRRAQGRTPPPVAVQALPPLGRDGAWTLAGLAVLAAGGLILRIDIGFMALLVIIALAVVAPRTQEGALARVDWSSILLISGIVIYVGVLERIGTVETVSTAIATLGSAVLAVLALCYLAGVLSAFASSTALLGVVIPLAVPLVHAGNLPAAGVVAALCIATTIVDTSPFSTNGALIVGNCPEGERATMLHKLLAYTAIVATIGPLLAWAAFVPR